MNRFLVKVLSKQVLLICIYMAMCVCVCLYLHHVYAGACSGQKRV
ncbi:mCG1049263 [Mus musculus]|nr:mCG1049263 [Mus musculus]